MRFFTIPILLFITIMVMAQSKSKIRIIHSDLNIGRKVGNEQLRILKGAVHVVKDTVHMYCDSAYFYEERNMLELLSNVRVDNGHRVIRAKKIIYFPDDNLVECIGFVRSSSDTDSLFTHRLVYNLKKKEAVATDSVFLWNREERVFITGDKAYLEEERDYFRVTRDAHFVQIDSSTQDSFQVVAQKLEYFGDTLNYAFAVDSVTIWQGGLKTESDTAWYYSKTEIAWLRGKPTVWFENNELNGDEIEVKMDSSKVKRLMVYKNAVAKTINDSLKNEYNLLKGKSIEFFMDENKPRLIIARLNASSKYFLTNETDQGINFSTSDSIYVFFKAGTLDSIEIIGGAEGIYYPDSYKGERKFGE
jgi:lipopolysaccharide export system protein LptA